MPAPLVPPPPGVPSTLSRPVGCATAPRVAWGDVKFALLNGTPAPPQPQLPPQPPARSTAAVRKTKHWTAVLVRCLSCTEHIPVATGRPKPGSAGHFGGCERQRPPCGSSLQPFPHPPRLRRCLPRRRRQCRPRHCPALRHPSDGDRRPWRNSVPVTTHSLSTWGALAGWSRG